MRTRTERAIATGESISIEEFAIARCEELVASGDAERGPVIDGKPTYRLTEQGRATRDRMRREGADPKGARS